MFRSNRPDGGRESGVRCWGIEIKWLFSILVLKFEPNDRENYHSHAFNALTFWLKGNVLEERQDTGNWTHYIGGSLSPKYTPRTNVHKIHCTKTAWAISLRGPWSKYWYEIDPEGNKIKLTKGRKII